VLAEARAGDPEAAQRRLAVVERLPHSGASRMRPLRSRWLSSAGRRRSLSQADEALRSKGCQGGPL
jgi:hypothetical protein